YARVWDARMGGDHWGPHAERRFFGDKHWTELLKWNRAASCEGQRRRIFVMSMGDWAEGRPDQAPHLERFWRLVPQTPWLDKLMLTKRPQLINKLYPHRALGARTDVWMGTTVENTRWMGIRWGHLREVEAAVYWLSMEPLFEAVKLPSDFLALGVRAWVIVGGQSGAHANRLDVATARYMRDQCREAGVPFFFKQGSQTENWGSSKEFKLFSTFPPDLQIREFPEPMVKRKHQPFEYDPADGAVPR
ncbi:MAG: DUF5131 family protein, partial [Patescibacteria group bacterium]|nr:DUF5131 family protein [Patescibacteria group bacterium]